MNVTVSVIVPVYNVEQYLYICLDSIINQSYQNLEVLLIDDGSTDRSSEICDIYERKYDYIKCFHLENSGVSNARNFGVSKALGEYIICIDSDDYLENEMIEKMVSKAKLHNADIVISAIDLFNSSYKGKRRHTKQCFVEKKEVIDRNELFKLVADNPLEPFFGAPYNKMIKKSLIMDNGIMYEEKAIIAEDTCFNYEIYSVANRIAFCEDVLYHHRLNAGISLSRRKHSVGSIDKRINAILMAFDRFNNSVYLEDYIVIQKYLRVINTFYIQKIVFDCNDLSYSKKVKKISSIMEKNEMYNGKFKFFIKHKMYNLFLIAYLSLNLTKFVVKNILAFGKN